MRIDGLPEQPKISQGNQRDAASRPKKASERPSDVVEISQDAREVAELAALAKTAPEEFNPRLQEIRGRIESGYYNSREAREQIAEALLESEGMREVVDYIDQVQVAKQKLAQIPDTREDRVTEARQRAGSGFYDSAKVRQDTAESILDELG